MDEQLIDLLSLGYRSLFLVLLPLIAAVSVAGFLAAIVEATLGIYESGVLYLARVLATVGVLVLMGGYFARVIMDLTLVSLGTR